MVGLNMESCIFTLVFAYEKIIISFSSFLVDAETFAGIWNLRGKFSILFLVGNFCKLTCLNLIILVLPFQ